MACNSLTNNDFTNFPQPTKDFVRNFRASNKMTCRTENERFFDMQGGRGKIAAGIVKAISRTILTRQRSRPENKPFEYKGILLDTLSQIMQNKPKLRNPEMKLNSYPAMTYENKTLRCSGKNKAKSNPTR